MKHLFYLAVLISFINVNAQIKYETFIADEKTGIVHIQSLEEAEKPVAYKRIFTLNENFFTPVANDTLKIFDKQTGKWKAHKKLRKHWPQMNLDGYKYAFSYENDQLALIDSTFEIVHKFKTNYKRPYYFYGNDYSFFGLANDSVIDIFLHKKTASFEHIKTIIASEMLYTQDASQDKVIVFYGGIKTYVFKKSGAMIEYDQQFGVDDRLGIYQLIDPQDEEIVEEIITDDTPYVEEVIKSDQFIPTKEKDGVTTYKAADIPLEIQLEGHLIYKNEGSTFTVFKVFKTERGTRASSKNGYKFKINFEKGEAILPLKYQRAMNLKISEL